MNNRISSRKMIHVIFIQTINDTMFIKLILYSESVQCFGITGVTDLLVSLFRMVALFSKWLLHFVNCFSNFIKGSFFSNWNCLPRVVYKRREARSKSTELTITILGFRLQAGEQILTKDSNLRLVRPRLFAFNISGLWPQLWLVIGPL